MSDDVLLRFVTKNLIDVKGDDAKLGSLREAAGDLAGILKKTPAKTLAFSLAAFDPEVPETDPAVAEAADALRGRWETYVNTFASTPVAVCRAMLLDALIQAARDNEAVAIGFAVSARNVLPFMEVGGEQEIWAQVVADVEKRVEERTEAEWATPASIDLPEIKLDPITLDESRVSSPQVNRDDLERKLWAAAGPNFITPKDGQDHSTEGNQHYPNAKELWIYEFGVRAATAVGEAIDGTIKSLAATVQAVSGATTGLQRRTDLLWWKEALFSPSARMSYRDIPVAVAAALMAFDMHRQIPAFSPASVAAFLRETVIALPNIDGDRKVPIRELVEDVRQSDVLAVLRTGAAELVAAPTGRGPLLALIGHSDVLSQLDDQSFRDLSGVKPDTELSLPDWSVWLLREFQAARTVAEASTPKPRTTPRKRTSRK